MRTSTERERWQALVSAAARGEPLSDAEAAYLEDVGAHRPEEAMQSPIWAAFAQLPDAPWPHERKAEELVRAAVHVASEGDQLIPPERRAGSTRRRSAWFGAAAVGLLLMAWRLALGPGAVGGFPLVASSDPAPRPIDPAPTIAPSPFPATPTQSDPDCEHPRAGLTICGDPKAVVDPGSAQKLPSLIRGRARIIAGGPHGESVAISTPLAVLRAESATYDAEIDERGVLVVTVTAGRVAAWQDERLVGIATSGHPLELIEVGASSTRAPSDLPSSSPARSPDRDLARAQSLVAQGRFAVAIRVYETLVTRAPNTPEAYTAMVTLGRLELDRDRPKAALRWFERALARDGRALEQEASYGRIRALEEQGRTAEAVRAIEAFVRDYPGSMYTPRLRRRRDVP